MLYDIMLSLRLYLTEYFPEINDVQFVYDGVRLTDIDKPFITVERLASPIELLSAGRSSYRETFEFQVGVFSRDFTEEVKLQEAVKTALMNRIPIYLEDGSKTDVTFDCTVSDFTSIRNDSTVQTTFDHRGYFDVTVVLLRDVGSKQFTQ